MGSKSSQNASIFHEKNDGGVKKYPGCPYTAIHEVAKIPKVLIDQLQAEVLHTTIKSSSTLEESLSEVGKYLKKLKMF